MPGPQVLPSTSNDDTYKKRVWDFWLTDYDPDFWPNVFEGDDKAKEPVKGSKGKELSPGPAPGQSASSSSGAAGVSSGKSRFLPTSSWLVYHGTAFHSAMVAIA